ncbi:MAG: hypothetical protein DMF94_26600 [Acidobacteria bacterium]|nr:MAG: hypothetical protein DMF96_27010 [Acidobacteriota bacterium]PYR16746.1 MAG: hypothetical protein DMF94_26600 [Acidobacteriota bacterium]
MSPPGLDVFPLRDFVLADYKEFATSFTTIHADDIRQQVEAIYARDRYWPEPLIQINPSYRRSTTIDRLATSGMLNPGCAEVFRTPPTKDAPTGEPLTLYKHQEQAIALASHGESYVVTTGTGSGKSLCFFVPIVSAVLEDEHASAAPRTRPIVIYPMNALANSQLEELDKFISNVRGVKPVTFARYTGQEDAETRRRISENPPDVLRCRRVVWWHDTPRLARASRPRADLHRLGPRAVRSRCWLRRAAVSLGSCTTLSAACRARRRLLSPLRAVA